MAARIGSICIKAGILLALLPLVLVPIYAFVPPVSSAMLWRFLTGSPVVREWRPLDQISPNLVRAVIAAEDARYCQHHRVDWHEMGHALGGADALGEARGPPAIAKQTAKHPFL